jgi:hypothetical protein
VVVEVAVGGAGSEPMVDNQGDLVAVLVATRRVLVMVLEILHQCHRHKEILGDLDLLVTVDIAREVVEQVHLEHHLMQLQTLLDPEVMV